MDVIEIKNNILDVNDTGPRAVSTPNRTDLSRTSTTLFNRFLNDNKHDLNISFAPDDHSPWLSKPRRPEPFLSFNKLSLSGLSNSLKCTPVTSERKIPIKIENESHERDNLPINVVCMRKLKLGLESLGINCNEEKWKSVCDVIEVSKSSQLVVIDDFVKVVKEIFAAELEIKGITDRQLISLMMLGLDESKSKLDLLVQENKNLRFEIQKLQDERSSHCDIERELINIRKVMQILLNDKRQLQAELVSKKEIKADKPVHKSQESQTNNPQDHINSISKKRLKKLEYNCKLYQLSTSKLLEFTKVVYNLLTDYKKSNSLSNGIETNPTAPFDTINRKPIRIKRAASVQNPSSDVTNYFVEKYGGGGRVCRAASTCTVAHKQIKPPMDDENDILQRLANKAREISSKIEDILSEIESPEKTRQERKIQWV